jgi:NAD-dependent SIR2 family protein deacetylase
VADVVPVARVEEAFARVAEADAVLVAGTSLMVYSGHRFVLAANKAGVPIAIVNKGSVTRAEKEGIPHLGVRGGCGAVLSAAVDMVVRGGGA